jgi:peptidoglycan/xylan/chitin deacetylase (PgdA/CDA1 family)
MMRAATTPNARRITVIFRFDDYCRVSSRVGTELLALFQKHHIPCTYGVIPYASGELSANPANCEPIDRETAGRLDDAVQSGLVEVALHGFTHSANAAVPASTRSGGSSEFSGLDYSTQLRMLSAGRSTLESLYHVGVTTFVPPWNSYDESTLRALDGLGFEVISASSDRYSVTAGGHTQRLGFLPCTCDLGDLREAVGTARESSDPEVLLVVLLHPYDFVEHDRDRGKFTYQSFDGLLSWLAAQLDVATQTLGEAAKLAQDLGPGRLEAVKALRLSQNSGPRFLRTTRKWFFYPSTRLARSMINVSRARLILFDFCLCLLVTTVTAVLAGLAASHMFSRMKPGSLPRIAEYATVSLLGLYVVYIVAVRSHNAVRHRHIMVLVGLLGLCLGTWVAASAHWMWTLWR